MPVEIGCPFYHDEQLVGVLEQAPTRAIEDACRYQPVRGAAHLKFYQQLRTAPVSCYYKRDRQKIWFVVNGVQSHGFLRVSGGGGQPHQPVQHTSRPTAAPVQHSAGSAQDIACTICGRALSWNAEVCIKCGARKGYLAWRGGVHGAVGARWSGVLVPGLIAAFLFFLGWDLHRWWIGAAGALCLVLSARSLYRLATGPVWHKHQHSWNRYDDDPWDPLDLFDGDWFDGDWFDWDD